MILCYLYKNVNYAFLTAKPLLPMRRRKFIKNSSLLITGSVLSTNMGCNSSDSSTTGNTAVPKKIRKNWAGNLTYSAPNLHKPSSIEELQQLIKSTPKFRMLGTQHCFNTIADSKNQSDFAIGLQ